MINSIRKWLADFKVRQKLMAECDGFGWAMSAYYIEGLSICAIRRFLDYGRQGHPFDDGAKEAIRLLTARIVLSHTSQNGEPLDAVFIIPDDHWEWVTIIQTLRAQSETGEHTAIME